MYTFRRYKETLIATKTNRIQKMDVKEAELLEMEHEMDKEHKMHKRLHKEHMYQKSHGGKVHDKKAAASNLSNESRDPTLAQSEDDKMNAPEEADHKDMRKKHNKKKMSAKQRKKKRKEAAAAAAAAPAAGSDTIDDSAE